MSEIRKSVFSFVGFHIKESHLFFYKSKGNGSDKFKQLTSRAVIALGSWDDFLSCQHLNLSL